MEIHTTISKLVALAAPRTRCFQETGSCISGSILDYWEQHTVGAMTSRWQTRMVRHPTTVGRRSCPHVQLPFERPLDAP
jgi:hypothetical protein